SSSIFVADGLDLAALVNGVQMATVCTTSAIMFMSGVATGTPSITMRNRRKLILGGRNREPVAYRVEVRGAILSKPRGPHIAAACRHCIDIPITDSGSPEIHDVPEG